MGAAPRASWRPVQLALEKRVSRSATSTSGSLASRNTEPWPRRRSCGPPGGGLEGGGQPGEAGEEVDVHLQEIMNRASHRQFEEVETDAAAPARRHRNVPAGGRLSAFTR